MPIHKLTRAAINAAKPAPQTSAHRRHARYGDGGGLWLLVDPDGNKTWAFLYTIDGRRRHLGLGKIADTDLDAARKRASDLRVGVRQGIDPLAEKDAQRTTAKRRASRPTAATTPTFREVATIVIPQRTAKMTNEKAKAQWGSTLATYVYPRLGDVPVDEIAATDLASILEELWSPSSPNERSKIDTGMKVRQRIRVVLDYAARHDWLDEARLASSPEQ